ncbi:unnamed protein product [Owenia fusiformis]|uniref:C2H2-type domain-containing protein n=1 Tax=Owenia fusiformis TaxID=6347 RepID=A0A8S4NP85_OWEFU|nr:unnamed protein product [Owenia fusiformis]
MAAANYGLEPVDLNNMSLDTLHSLIPSIVKHTTGRRSIGWGYDSYKPVWWPGEIPWQNMKNKNMKQHRMTSLLKKIIRSCYTFYGQEDLLEPQGKTDKNQNVCNPLTLPDDSRNKDASDVMWMPATSLEKPLVVLTDKVNMLGQGSDQASPKMVNKYPNLGSLLSSGMKSDIYNPKSDIYNTNVLSATVPSTSRQIVEVFVCFFCETEFHSRCDLTEHQSLCEFRPPELQSCMNLTTPPRPSLYRGLPTPPQLSPKRPTMIKQATKLDYIQQLALVPVDKAQRIRMDTPKRKILCENLDFTDMKMSTPLQNDSPTSPLSPKTPRSLMSQLSRDMTYTPITQRGSDAGSDYSYSDNGEEGTETGGILKPHNLLSIDITSQLGQRIKKHVRVQEVHSYTKNNPEVCCHTPKRNVVYQKLRHRDSNFPITYKKTRKNDCRYNREYKFTRAQKREFMKRVESGGLNKASRQLKRKMKKCSVRVSKMTKKQVERIVLALKQMRGRIPITSSRNIRWLAEHSLVDFPRGPALMQQDITKLLGLSTINSPYKLESTKQRAVLYRSLLNDFNRNASPSSSDESLVGKKPADVIVIGDEPHTNKFGNPGLKPELMRRMNSYTMSTLSSRRAHSKCPVHRIPPNPNHDNSIDVISLSSDESDTETPVPCKTTDNTETSGKVVSHSSRTSSTSNQKFEETPKLTPSDIANSTAISGKMLHHRVLSDKDFDTNKNIFDIMSPGMARSPMKSSEKVQHYLKEQTSSSTPPPPGISKRPQRQSSMFRMVDDEVSIKSEPSSQVKSSQDAVDKTSPDSNDNEKSETESLVRKTRTSARISKKRARKEISDEKASDGRSSLSKKSKQEHSESPSCAKKQSELESAQSSPIESTDDKDLKKPYFFHCTMCNDQIIYAKNGRAHIRDHLNAHHATEQIAMVEPHTGIKQSFQYVKAVAICSPIDNKKLKINMVKVKQTARKSCSSPTPTSISSPTKSSTCTLGTRQQNSPMNKSLRLLAPNSSPKTPPHSTKQVDKSPILKSSHVNVKPLNRNLFPPSKPGSPDMKCPVHDHVTTGVGQMHYNGNNYSKMPMNLQVLQNGGRMRKSSLGSCGTSSNNSVSVRTKDSDVIILD